MRTFAAVSLFAVLELISYTSQAIGLPLVVSATVDYAHNTLTISGQNFGSNPSVTLDALAFQAQVPTSGSQIVANFPSGKPPGSFTPGTYFLTVTFKNQLPTVFAVDIGANGAQGPAGPAGVPGAPGVAGATGPAGPAGPQGLAGPVGPVGAPGATGAAGAQGVAGPAGPQGLQGVAGATGATGPQGPAGTNGSGGGTLPTCDATSPYLVIANGALVCEPRYVDNGDGTVTDYKTGLMWEKKSPVGAGDGHDVRDTYTWNDSAVDANFEPSGSLFAVFLLQLNGLNVSNGAPCFAGYCDWRIPEIGELRTLLSAPFPCTTVCIDPIFGPTQSSFVWSATSYAGVPYAAFSMHGPDGQVGGAAKGLSLQARVVRSIH